MQPPAEIRATEGVPGRLQSRVGEDILMDNAPADGVGHPTQGPADGATRDNNAKRGIMPDAGIPPPQGSDQGAILACRDIRHSAGIQESSCRQCQACT